MFTIPDNTKSKVYNKVKMVPKGMVTTYKQISIATGVSPRVVGNALHLNTDPEVPCHRVVNVAGRIAPSFGLGGPAEQKKRLENEGIYFKNENHVKLSNHLYVFE